MNYKTVKVMGVDVPVFEDKNGIEYYYIGKRINGYDYISQRSETYAKKANVKLKSSWQPKEGERVLFESGGCFYIGKYRETIKDKINETYHYVVIGQCGRKVKKIAKYDQSKPAPETWAEVEENGEVLEV